MDSRQGDPKEALPPQFADAVAPSQLEGVECWWASLSAEIRQELVDSLDARWDSRQFIKTGSNGSTQWHRIPARIQARFSEVDEDDHGTWHSDFYDYLVNHEVYLTDLRQTFHICTRHPIAEAAVRSGRIPSDFNCPFAHAGCPMRLLLTQGNGCAIRLEVVADTRATLPNPLRPACP